MMSAISVLNESQNFKLTTTGRLFSIWTARYLSKDSFGTVSPYILEDSASFQGRQQTAERLRIDLVEEVCQRAAIRTKDLYTHYQNLDLEEIGELAKFALQIYPVLLQFYSNHAPLVVFPEPKVQSVNKSALKLFAIPEIHTLANLIEPFLSEFQSRDVRAINWKTRSFLTTEFNLSGKLLLEFLSPAEQVLLSPYINFLEEYVAIPWQRVCTTAADHTLTSPRFKLVERMLPKSSEISMAVYIKGCKIFGGYYNRRGQLDNPGVKHSSLRDLEMFQAYLWLCVLQGDLDAIEQELWVFCDLVYKGIGVPWEMAFRGTKLLVAEIMKNLNPHEQDLLSPYADGFIQAFAC